MVAALGVFVALIVGSASRPILAAAAPPEPAAWTAGTADMGAHAGPMPGGPSAISQPGPAASRSPVPANKTNQKPFRHAWSTKERPLTWDRLSPHSVLTPVPSSFSPTGCASGAAQSRSLTTVIADRDILARLCIARR
ncbi:hypothetical protein [Mycobacterium mantenii]|uniref:Uncharacterized protein n=2 Tax=Mycobacterium mantenii TaxID=560555 RepID=A0A1A2SYI8_MYCNT|nr:hypothetical protein [Mycobacterium mantenii]OBH47845.1 hypothetical protein A5687_16075 [Mycobacterium mantenii]OBH49607.1 hypothetical protein A5688_22665 [Mycobacterium mantenii]OBH68959.1 hypothetical protein A5683_06150 [Mycobacterium mantenii]OBH69151.1 hypothetical protein A5682_11490 [Mycobacterium mantenii]